MCVAKQIQWKPDSQSGRVTLLSECSLYQPTRIRSPSNKLVGTDGLQARGLGVEKTLWNQAALPFSLGKETEVNYATQWAAKDRGLKAANWSRLGRGCRWPSWASWANKAGVPVLPGRVGTVSQAGSWQLVRKEIHPAAHRGRGWVMGHEVTKGWHGGLKNVVKNHWES